MRYITMILDLLEQRPEIAEPLRQQRRLLATAQQYAEILRIRHDAWKELFTQTKPNSHESQISTEALEIALEEMERFLLSVVPPGDSESLSLDAAMAFLRPSPPA